MATKESGTTPIPAFRPPTTNNPNEMTDNNYSSTPGGTVYSTTPGGENITYIV